MRTYIYVDAYNLYYRQLKSTPYKWLDLKKLCTILLKPQNTIVKIKYFTARINGDWDISKPLRQDIYLQAIKAYIPEIEIIEGEYKCRNIFMPTVESKGKKFVKIIKSEEKGSDVNLAVNLLHDGWSGCYDCAVVISNDSDLKESLKIVKNELKRVIGLFITDSKNAVKSLIDNSHFQKHIRENVLESSLLPSPIPNTNLYCPDKWKPNKYEKIGGVWEKKKI